MRPKPSPGAVTLATAEAVWSSKVVTALARRHNLALTRVPSARLTIGAVERIAAPCAASAGAAFLRRLRRDTI